MEKVILWFNEETLEDLKKLQKHDSKLQDFNEYLENLIICHLEERMDIIEDI